MSWKAGVAAEVIGVVTGSLGERLYDAKIYLQTADLLAWTAVIVALSALFERLVLALLRTRREGKQGGAQVDIKKIFPWFVLLFLVASIITTVLPIPGAVTGFLKNASKFFIVMAMAAIGLNTNIIKLVKTGGKPLIMGFCCWVGIASMSLLMQHVLGIW